MLSEWNKCNFCKYNVENKCTSYYCIAHRSYRANKNKIILKAKELNMSVTDVIALINLEEL